MTKADPEIEEIVAENDREARQEQMARIEARGFKVKVSNVYPPIPIRQFDWCAYIDGHEENTTWQGWGKTQLEAIDDLLDNMNL